MIPEDFCFDANRCGLDFRMNAFPRDAKGQVLYRGSSEDDYLAYVSWLADYLHDTHLEPSIRQKTLCDQVRTETKEWAIQLVGMNAGLYGNIMARLDCAILDVLQGNYDWNHNHIDRILEFLQHETEEDRRSDPEHEDNRRVSASVEITCGCTRQDVEARITEMREEKDLVGDLSNNFCDVGWRVPLSVVLHDVPDKDERVGLLDLFCAFCDEYSWK